MLSLTQSTGGVGHRGVRCPKFVTQGGKSRSPRESSRVDTYLRVLCSLSMSLRTTRGASSEEGEQWHNAVMSMKQAVQIAMQCGDIRQDAVLATSRESPCAGAPLLTLVSSVLCLGRCARGWECPPRSSKIGSPHGTPQPSRAHAAPPQLSQLAPHLSLAHRACVAGRNRSGTPRWRSG